MTGDFLLDWSIMAVSLFNTILLFWLGLTVLLNAERRTWGMWLAGGGLLMGGLFFVSHTAILGLGLTYVGRGMNFWWRVGWVPVVISPFAWYIVMLWYAGFWENRETRLHHRHRSWLFLSTLLIIGLAGLLFFANPLPSYWQTTQLDLTATPDIGGIPLLILIYPIYIILCIGLSIDVLRRPGPSARIMGDIARHRARPWLIATSIALLLVSLLVAWIMVWIVLNARQRTLFGLYTDMVLTVAWFDLVIAALIAGSTILLGQAIVSYEVFTGKTLPRRGLRSQWRRAVILAAGYSVVIGGGITLQIRPIYGLLLSAILITLFHALLSWRSYAERERYIDHLRPFVASQRLYEHLLTTASTTPPDVDAETPFHALCNDILGTRTAYLVALGPLAPLVGPPLVYPKRIPTPQLPLSELIPSFNSPQTICWPLNPADYAGAKWAVPLWSERGLIGVLLLGDKYDGGLYTQEEIEIARASGERLIDTQASVEMARRLMVLQRQRLAQSQVLDRQARRMLHDDVLPLLHTAMLSLNREGDNGSSPDAVELLTEVHHQISSLLREIPAAISPEVARRGLIGAIQKMVEDELAYAFDEVVWQIEPEAAEKIDAISSLTGEVLFYAVREIIRNAAHHARADSTNPLHLTVTITWRDELNITIEDNGVGLTTGEQANGGSGQGLALHSTMLAVVGGSLTVESIPGMYTRVLLTLPQESTIS